MENIQTEWVVIGDRRYGNHNNTTVTIHMKRMFIVVGKHRKDREVPCAEEGLGEVREGNVKGRAEGGRNRARHDI